MYIFLHNLLSKTGARCITQFRCKVTAGIFQLLNNWKEYAWKSIPLLSKKLLRSAVFIQLIAVMMATGAVQAFATDTDMDCDTQGNEATRKVGGQCVGNAICSKVLLMQETCPQFNQFINWLEQFSFGVIEGSTAFSAIAPKLKEGDSAIDAVMALAAHDGRRAKKTTLWDSDFDGKTWIYEGGVLKDKRHGFGVMLFDDGTMFYGEFVKGKQTGRGDRVDKNGTRSIGYMRNMKLSGQGARRYSDGYRYDGSFDSDKRSGKGILTHSNGYRYEGDWKEDQATGKGKIQYSDGAVYEGEVVNFKREGMGEIHTKDGQHYVGQWKADSRSGQGEQSWEDGDRYQGSFINNQRTGQGTYFFKSGSKYVGAFSNGKQHGQGVFSWPDGTRFEGEWKDNEKFNGVEISPTGSRLVFRNGNTEKQAIDQVSSQYNQNIRAAQDGCNGASSECGTGCSALGIFGALAKDSNAAQGLQQCLDECSTAKNQCWTKVTRLQQERDSAIERARRDFR